EGDRDGEGDIDKPGDIDGPGDIGGGSAGLARIAFGGAAPSACTTVGAAELRELGSSRSWVCEPPGFIAAESSRASAIVETWLSISMGSNRGFGALRALVRNGARAYAARHG